MFITIGVAVGGRANRRQLDARVRRRYKDQWNISLSWDISCRTWEEFPSQQKWFAFGETLAHLAYLEGKGVLCSEVSEGLVFYSLA